METSGGIYTYLRPLTRTRQPSPMHIYIGSHQLLSEVVELPHPLATCGEVATLLASRLCFSHAAARRFMLVLSLIITNFLYFTILSSISGIGLLSRTEQVTDTRVDVRLDFHQSSIHIAR